YKYPEHKKNQQAAKKSVRFQKTEKSDCISNQDKGSASPEDPNAGLLRKYENLSLPSKILIEEVIYPRNVYRPGRKSKIKNTVQYC
ncbi:hypothetical protein, partial [Pseudomonas aeruginosa]|uniref:hypothetical protein n=1 Tax=Pseudomonas aeruginosa TaxID=287 RepID=UPI0031B6F152